MRLLNLLPQLVPPPVALPLLPLRARHLVLEPVHLGQQVLVVVGALLPAHVLGSDPLERGEQVGVRGRGGPEGVEDGAAVGL